MQAGRQPVRLSHRLRPVRRSCASAPRNGQPAAQALTPTLELHIALAADHCSSTPDVRVRRDSAASVRLRLHLLPDPRRRFLRHPPARFDRTLAGFLARVVARDAGRPAPGPTTVGEALANWARCSRCRSCSPVCRTSGARSTTTRRAERRDGVDLLPRAVQGAARCRTRRHGSTPRVPSAYQASDIRAGSRRPRRSEGSELAVHGIDAWRDADAGRARDERS